MTQADRRTFLAGVGSSAAASLGVSAARANPRNGPRRAAPRAAIDALVAAERKVIAETMAKENVDGVAVCFLYEGEPVWVEGLGVTDRPSGRPVSTDTIFSIQSTSKNFTATAILLAVQEGLLDLDAPITTYLPDFAVQSRFEPVPEAKMTLRLLLSHRAGFTHEAPVGNNYDPAFPNSEAHVRSISQTWLRYPVGERYRYSNLGYDLAGWILQVRSGMPFADWLRTKLFEPLGMADSTVATEVYERRENRAVGHATGYATVPLRTPLIPSGGVYVSARDMAAYAKFHLDRGKVGGEVLLREDLWDEMHGFALGGDYGLGVIRTERRYGETALRMLGHKGGGFGFGSVFDYCPPARLARAALFNRPADSAYRFGEGLLDGALAKRYGPRRPRLAAQDLAPIQLTPAQAQAFVGTYVGRDAMAEMRIKDGVLDFRQGRNECPLSFTSPVDMFRVRPDGEVTTYRYFPAKADEPAHFECAEGEISLDYNDGPHDAPGPADPAWARFLGQYRIYQWGAPVATVSIRQRNGWLYLDQTRLVVEPEPGLFFTSDGEAVDFRRAEPTWKNIRLERIS